MEDGEIDMERSRAFTSCARRKFRENKKLLEQLRREESRNKNREARAKESEKELEGKFDLTAEEE